MDQQTTETHPTEPGVFLYRRIGRQDWVVVRAMIIGSDPEPLILELDERYPRLLCEYPGEFVGPLDLNEIAADHPRRYDYDPTR